MVNTKIKESKLILASTSPRRKELAEQMGLDFEIIPSNYEEDMTMNLSAPELAKTLARGKALEVANRLEEGIVLGVDTFVTYDGKKLGKPKSKAEAKQMLQKFSGNTVEVYSGVSLINAKSKKEIQDYEVTKVMMRKISDDEIDKYIKTGEPMDKAGAFAIQGLGSVFIKKIDGCYPNVVGFPIDCVYKNLIKMGINVTGCKQWTRNN